MSLNDHLACHTFSTNLIHTARVTNEFRPLHESQKLVLVNGESFAPELLETRNRFCSISIPVQLTRTFIELGVHTWNTKEGLHKTANKGYICHHFVKITWKAGRAPKRQISHNTREMCLKAQVVISSFKKRSSSFNWHRCSHTQVTITEIVIQHLVSACAVQCNTKFGA